MTFIQLLVRGPNGAYHDLADRVQRPISSKINHSKGDACARCRQCKSVLYAYPLPDGPLGRSKEMRLCLPCTAQVKRGGSLRLGSPARPRNAPEGATAPLPGIDATGREVSLAGPAASTPAGDYRLIEAARLIGVSYQVVAFWVRRLDLGRPGIRVRGVAGPLPKVLSAAEVELIRAQPDRREKRTVIVAEE